MKGTVRVIALHRKCPTCKKPFFEYPRFGYICKEHQTMPRKFFIDIKHKNERYRIFRDERGAVLDSYDRARTLLHKLNTDIDLDRFDPSGYVRAEQKKFYLIERWKKYCSREYAKKYRMSLLYAEKYILAHFKPSTDIREIRQESIQLFFDDLMEKVPTVSTAKNITAILNAFLNRNHTSGLVANRFTMPKTEMKKRNKSARIPEIAESMKIISYIDEQIRDIYLFLITHGCRPAEARAIQAGDFNFAERTVTIQRGFSGDELHDFTKTGHEYTIPIHAALYEKLKKICLEKMPGEFVFMHRGCVISEYKIYRYWKAAAVKAGSPHISIYVGVKHAGASEIASKTGDVYNTSKFIGHHGGIQNTMRYTGRRDIEKLRKLQSMIVIPATLISEQQCPNSALKLPSRNTPKLNDKRA